MQVPRGFEEAVCSLAKLERAIVSCPAGKAHSPGSVLPPPPEGADRVEFELHLLSMIQVGRWPNALLAVLICGLADSTLTSLMAAECSG